MSVKTPIHDFLINYGVQKRVSCHMPGNKGRLTLNSAHDITEINGADSLYESRGIIAESECIAASLFGAEHTLFSCSGSTLAIQAMLALVKSNGGNRIAAFRYAHRSFVSAAALLGFDVDWIYPKAFLSAEVTPDNINAAIKTDTAAVFLNSLDYYGQACGVKSAAEVCKAANIPLLVDNAHGAYLVFTDKHPLALGAAMTADSAHKTLPALTGAAYLHIKEKGFAESAKAMTALFGTSSPSYLLLESLDLCNKHIAEDKPKAFNLIAGLKVNLRGLGFRLRESDALRITVNTRESGYTGAEFAEKLRENNVECEYADENCTVLLFSTVSTIDDVNAVRAAFENIERKKPLKPSIIPVLRPKRIMSVREALFVPDRDCLFLPPGDAVGKVCAGIYAPCPPCVPFIMPGEKIGEEEAGLLKHFGVSSIRTL
ncbi:MAG: aminotransferase class I/II-fold pyridoxal phosphate-dependent enzyme [Oscillospiraceae bacterium]|nr:aminotransferase class I/II-fold pyridoxal phosphate-dependent enzyme [Oscillospiraceae bacterium]